MMRLVLIAGCAQLLILIASVQVPYRLRWREELAPVAPLTRQMHWVYGGYVVLSIATFALLSIFNARELTAGGSLARAIAAYIAVFWGVRLVLQGVFDIQPYLSSRWLRAGYFCLGVLFAGLTIVYGAVALGLGS